MAHETEIVKVLGTLAAAYPRFPLTKATSRVYVRLLLDLPVELLEDAALHSISTSEWFPTIAKLRAAAVEILAVQAGVPTQFEAWAEVQRMITRPIKQRKWHHPLILEAMEGIGGMNSYGHSLVEAEASWRARFFEAYAAMIRREQEKLLVPQIERLAEEGELKRLKEGKDKVGIAADHGPGQEKG